MNIVVALEKKKEKEREKEMPGEMKRINPVFSVEKSKLIQAMPKGQRLMKYQRARISVSRINSTEKIEILMHNEHRHRL